ncbi:hypothetical protein FRC08_018596 [Ceratobasidium sp. 394]|nr:hypothetical protein FRC08_018596 [Ceratobasidium sp. 394]
MLCASPPAPDCTPAPTLAPASAPVPAPHPAPPTTCTLSNDGDKLVGDLFTTQTFLPPSDEACNSANEEAYDQAVPQKWPLQFHEWQLDYEHQHQEIGLDLLKREADGNEHEHNKHTVIARPQHQANQHRCTQCMKNDHK